MQNNKYIYISLLAVLSFNNRVLAQRIQQAPRLVVNITIDQLRTDYLQAFSPLYGNEGFKRLLNEGRVYSNAAYPFSPIDRASAWATISTGVTPYYHSVIGERWLDKETLRPVYCVDDADVNGIQTQDRTSPKHLTTSTISDELKVATEGKAIVYAIAPFRDAAIFAAGHAADAALWLDDQNGYWCSSSYYLQQLPAWLQTYNEANAPANQIAKTVWEPLTATTGSFSFFTHTDSRKPFRHKFVKDNRFQSFKTSALMNEQVTNLALQCITSNTMGSDLVTDMLNLTYYAGNFDHKTMTECQMELQDTYFRLDREIGKLVSSIERIIGKGEVLFIVTSTGYSDTESTDYAKYRIPTGTFYINRTANLLNMYFGAIWGQGRYVEACFRNQMFLNHKLLESRRVSLTDATMRAQEFLSQLSGVRNTYTSQQLINNINEQTYKIRNGFNAERNGDILIEVSPGWRLQNEDTQENELSRASFIEFPVIMFGPGINAERITDRITIDRIAPTIAKSIRIRAPNACSSEPLF